MLELFTDTALVEEVRAGDRDAGLVLWRRHSTDCRAAVASVVDDPRTTERVLRETFDRVLREIAAGTDPLAPFHLYLRTTALLDACLDGCSSVQNYRRWVKLLLCRCDDCNR